MSMDQVYTHEGVSVDYQFRKSRSDRQHLVVVFSGFREIDSYDFRGEASKGLRANVLWIKEKFNEHQAYYYRSSELDIGVVVNSLIESTLEACGLSQSQCTLIGFSKGGTAAIYYGLRYDFKNIIATVPQFFVGNYLLKYRPDLLSKIFPAGIEGSSVDHLNGYLTDLVAGDAKVDKNIYIFTSPSDEQYVTDILPNVETFEKYNNFNLIETLSPLVTQHNEVTKYNIPLIVSIIASITDNAIPRYGWVGNGMGHIQKSPRALGIERVQSRRELVAEFEQCIIREGHIYPEGHAFVMGHKADKHGMVRSSIVISSLDRKYEYQLGSVLKKELTYKYFENDECDYTSGGFASPGYRGIDLRKMEYGQYHVGVTVAHAGISVTKESVSAKGGASLSSDGADLYVLDSRRTGLRLAKRPLFRQSISEGYFDLVDYWARGSLIHVEGYFVVLGQAVPNYGDARYFLLLRDRKSGDIVLSYDLANANKKDAGILANDPYLDYSKSYYATFQFNGINIKGTPSGEYDLYVTFATENIVNTKPLNLQLNVDIDRSFYGLSPIA